jgi:hypothetical protein
VVVALGRRRLALEERLAVNVRRRRGRCGSRVAKRREGRAIGARCGRGWTMAGPVHVLADVKSIGWLVWGGRRVVLLGRVVLEIEAPEGGKAEVAVGHVRGRVGGGGMRGIAVGMRVVGGHRAVEAGRVF